MMPGYLLTGTLLALLAISVQGQPGPDQCETNPCNGTECSRFLNADCIIIVSLGECRARFSWKGRDVTNKCQARTCDSRQCGKNRECMEEVFPPSCPEDKPINTCRQYIRSKCVLQPFERPLSCDDIECGEGMMCRFRERSGGFPPVVRCVQATPQDCSELDCEEGFTCVMRNLRPVCVIVPTTELPITTDITTPEPDCGFDCSIFGQVCEVVNNTAVCVDATSCDQLTCDVGNVCVESDTGASCTLLLIGETCDELDCLSIFAVCVQLEPNVAACRLPTECTPEFDARCREVFAVCGMTAEGIIGCAVPTSCDQITCDMGFSCFEVVLNETRIASCLPDNTVPMVGLRCEDLTCGQGESCYLQQFPTVNLTLAQCSAQPLIDVIAAGIRSATADCDDQMCPPETGCVSFSENELPKGAICLPIGCNDTTPCPPGNFTCISLADTGVPVNDFDSVCSPDDVMVIPGGETCVESDRECPIGSRCAEVSIGGVFGGTICTSVPITARSCDDITCTGEDEGCSVTALPDTPGMPTLAQCLQDFENLTDQLESTLRLLGFIP